jgi:DNA-binding NarL/FixJ family response regulator
MRIVIAEDAALFRAGLVRLLEDEGHQVCAEACPRRKPTTAGSWPCCVTSVPDRVGSWRG